jgi:hypothetical protein
MRGKKPLPDWRVGLYFYSPILNSTRIWRVVIHNPRVVYGVGLSGVWCGLERCMVWAWVVYGVGCSRYETGTHVGCLLLYIRHNTLCFICDVRHVTITYGWLELQVPYLSTHKDERYGCCFFSQCVIFFIFYNYFCIIIIGVFMACFFRDGNWPRIRGFPRKWK